jgi:colanic acid/amylovoran biosynthesis glycosyltransferase
MNWLYDHLRFVPGYAPLVLADELVNRAEFPQLAAWQVGRPTPARRLWRRLLRAGPYAPHLRRLERIGPVLIHTHFGYVATGDLALRASLALPWVVSFYGADVYQLGRLPEWRERYEQVFAAATRVLALGPAMAAALEELGCPRAKLEVQALGVAVHELPAARRRLDPGQALQVLFAGTFREKKGAVYAVDALRRARAAGACLHLHLVGDQAGKPGDAETKAEVFSLIDRHGLGDLVTHHSWLRFDDLLALALRCHVFIAPSVTAADGDAEGTPFVIQQMMATGMPVIATRHSDIPFLFGPHAGMLVTERDAAAIAERLVRYASDGDALAADGRALRDHALQALDVRHCASGLASVYAATTGRTAVPAEIAGPSAAATAG